MPEMPSADMRTTMTPSAVATVNINVNTIRNPDYSIISKEVEGLVLEIKENLRLSASTMKALPCSNLSRKSSRASPYRIPGKHQVSCSCTCTCTCDNSCLRKAKRKLHQQDDLMPEDPYELLQKLLRDGSLVNEAVRRVKLDLTPKQRYFYESDDETTPVLRFFSQEI